MHAIVNWQKGLSFQADNRGVSSCFDTTKENGGEDSAPSPKEAVLNAMCACSGMDVVSVATKMRLSLTSLSMEARAEKSSTIPSYFSKVHIIYRIEGDDEPEKFIKNVVFSMTKYCGVSYMISKVCPITYDVYLNDKLIYQDEAKFSLEVVENG
jgi:putative redox protein